MTERKTLMIALLVVIELSVFSQANTRQKPDGSRVSTASAKVRLSKFLTENHVPGAAVAVSVGGKVIWAEGFGFADVEQQVPVDPSRTLFRIASISKPLTATGMAILMEQGKIHPDSSVHHYLPRFPKKKFRPTVRQVAGHIGGIRHYRGNENFSNIPYKDVTSGLSIFQDDSLMHPPGSAYLYSSYGYNLLGAVVESASGTSFLTFIQRNVLDPLGMKSTTADRQDSLIRWRGRFYEHDGRPSPAVDNSYKWAGGGYLSTATDLITFGNSYLSGKILQPSTIRQLTATQYLRNGQSTGYGMGWSGGTDASGRRYFGHSGGAVGGTCILTIYPDENMVIVLLTNMSGVPLHHLPEELASDILVKTKGNSR